MQYNWKLFKWNDAIGRTEFTKYLVAPVFLELRCNEQLSSGEVILDCVPKDIQLKPFPPKTRFTLECWVGGQLDRYHDFMVDRDEVEHYEGYPEVCCHRIQLIEPSVFAQGLTCDNFGLTYELNDVTLKYKTVVSNDDKAVVNSGGLIGEGFERPNWEYGQPSYAPQGITAFYKLGTGDYTLNYTNSYIYRWTGLDALKDRFTFNLSALIAHNIEFEMPVLECYANNGTAAPTFLFNCPVRCNVIRTTLKNGLPQAGTATTVKSQLYNPIGVQDRNDRLMYNSGGAAGLRTTLSTNYKERSSGYGTEYATKVFRETEILNLPTMINTNDTSHAARTVSFTTSVLSQAELEIGLSYSYSITMTIEPYQSGALVERISKRCVTAYTPRPWWNPLGTSAMDYTITTTADSRPSPSSCIVSLSFLCRDMLVDAAYTPPFLIKGRKYNCYDLFRRAMLTTDTQIFDNNQIGLDEMYDENGNDIGIQYPIEVDSVWARRMKEAVMFESIFEQKNLWEVLQQIGHYLHAIPYLEFARNGKDRFVLKFKQLGGTDEKNNDSNKITVFNSQTLDNFFTQYDSYVTNLFSPQNEVDEWLVCKTSDSSFLVSNETAELHTKYNITELLAFDITYNGQTKSALEFVFEKSVYNILSSKTNFVPAKWSALYFEIGTSKILGLNYVPPTPSTGEEFMALKTIVGKLFSDGERDKKLKFNDLRFHVRYKTQDSLRITQVRPDLEQFLKSSEYEKYPHHMQFYNPQDKIVDSERFSANLWGRLIRVANGIYQCQENPRYGQEKVPGELVEVYGESYYVTEVENEYYPDAVFQKVTYSKNFNQLSNIVTIPSEPRFFEIAERALIRREVRLLDFIKISTKPNTLVSSPRFINENKWHSFIRDLLFCDNGNPQLPNFAYTNYKGDKLREHYNLPNNDTSIMFPSSEAHETADGTTEPKQSLGSRAVIVPLLHFPLRNAIVFEWDMDDNFKAGDCKDVTSSGTYFDDKENELTDKAYQSIQPVRYCDTYGRADLFDFKLFYKDDWSESQEKRLPFAEESDFIPTDEQSDILLPSNLSIGLDKDNREEISFNYQINLLHEPYDNDTEDFVIFSNLFGEKNTRLRCALLNITVSMFNEAIKINASTIVSDNVKYNFTNADTGIKIDFETPQGASLADVKSIVLYDLDNTVTYAYLAKNVAMLPNESKLQSWYIYPVYNN